jgi:hypothetical protein
VDRVNRLSLYEALRDIATGVITRALEIQGRIEAGIEKLERVANKEDVQ